MGESGVVNIDQPSPTPPPARPPAAPGEGRKALVGSAIALVAVTFVAMVGMLYYTWYRRPPALTTVLVVIGDKRHDGAVVTVHGTSLQLSCRMSEQNDYLCRIPLPAGWYVVQIDHGKNTLFHESVEVRAQQPGFLDLTKQPDRPNR